VTTPDAAAAFEALLARRGGDAVLLLDASLRVVRAGDEVAALAERPVEALTGMSLIAALGSASVDALARRAAASGDPASGEADLGHLGARTFAVDALPIEGGGVVLSLHDITALRRMERVRRDFVANTGHELRTPLTSIKLLAETLASGAGEDPALAAEFAAQIERETDHLVQLVDELLELTRIESGETNLVLEPADPSDLLAACAERIAPVAQRREVAVRVLPPPDGHAAVRVDRQRLGQALLNLAHNAVKFSRPGGEVRLSWQRTDGHVRLAVADDGVGIPEQHQPRVFERFYKVDRSRTPERDAGVPGGSAGLGLSIVRHIAEAHGGSVGMSSEEGVGSTFWIEVPAVG
jgi:two-component system phosphate regulon sensor histidine kinase PhoR